MPDDGHQLDFAPPDHANDYRSSELFVYFCRRLGEHFGQFRNEVDGARSNPASQDTWDGWRNRNQVPGATTWRRPIRNAITKMFVPEISARWINVFEHVWALEPGRKKSDLLTEGAGIEGANETTEPHSQRSDHAAGRFLAKHSTWIKKRFRRTIMGESFSLSEVYVPIGIVHNRELSYTALSPDDLKTELLSDTPRFGKNQWYFIRGGPGSGKSALACWLADALETGKPEQARRQTISLRANQFSSANSFEFGQEGNFVSDRYPLETFFQAVRQSGFNTMVLIIDGIDELGEAKYRGVDRYQDVVNRILAIVEACDQHDIDLRVVAFGRHTETDIFESRLNEANALSLSMASLAGSIPELNDGEPGEVGPDLRVHWWLRYCKARGLEPTDTPPDFLESGSSPLFSFGLEPLLAYLVCRIAFEPDKPIDTSRPANLQVDEFVDTDNRNRIYAQIFDTVREPKIWRGDGAAPLLDRRSFITVLRYMALAAWHEGGLVRTSVARVQAAMHEQADTAQAFNSLVRSSCHGDTGDTLITVFYYRVEQSEELYGGNEIEFTHRTFAEYLVALHIFDTFDALLNAYLAPDKDRYCRLLSDWIRVVAWGPQYKEIAEFIQDEAELRLRGSLKSVEWTRALDMVREISEQIDDSGSATGGDVAPLQERQRAAETVLLVWSALNRADVLAGGRQKRLEGDTVHGISHYDLKMVVPPLLFETDDISKTRATRPQAPNFTGYCLMATEVDGWDLSGMAFSSGWIWHVDWKEVQLNFSHLRSTDFDESVLTKVTSHHAQYLDSGFTDTDLRDCRFNHCEFSDVTWSGGTLRNVYFDQCEIRGGIFVSCALESVTFRDCMIAQTRFGFEDTQHSFKKIRFERCTFLEMDDGFVSRGDIVLDEHCRFISE